MDGKKSFLGAPGAPVSRIDLTEDEYTPLTEGLLDGADWGEFEDRDPLDGYDWSVTGIDPSDRRWSWERIDPAQIKTHVYFIHEDSEGDPIKIGIAKNPHRRMRTLQTGNSKALTLMGYIKGTRSDETKIHQRFANTRIIRKDRSKGEWFESTPELLALIEELLTLQQRR
jgi:hypothetical protein